MKRFFTLATIALGLVGLSNKAQAAFPYDGGCCPQVQYDSGCCGPAPCCDNLFEGFYIGGNVGWAFQDRAWVDRDAWVDNFSTDWALGTVYTVHDGVTAGGQIGYNWRCCCALFGIEADARWANIHHKRNFSPAVGATRLTLQDRLRWFGTIRGRAGIVCNDLLLYFTAGAAYGNFRTQWSITDPEDVGENFRDRHTRWGLAFGTGAEWAFSECVSLKAEGLILKFPQRTSSFFSAAGDQRVHFDVSNTIWVATVGLNFNLSSLWCCW